MMKVALTDESATANKEARAATEYFREHHHTFHEYHVIPSPCSNDKFWVVNALGHTECTHHSSYAEAQACAMQPCTHAGRSHRR